MQNWCDQFTTWIACQGSIDADCCSNQHLLIKLLNSDPLLLLLLLVLKRSINWCGRFGTTRISDQSFHTVSLLFFRCCNQAQFHCWCSRCCCWTIYYCCCCYRFGILNNMKIMTKSIDWLIDPSVPRRLIRLDQSVLCCQSHQHRKNRSSAPLKNQVDHAPSAL